MTGEALPTTDLGTTGAAVHHGIEPGPGAPGRIVLVHGFTQTAASWRVAAEHLASALVDGRDGRDGEGHRDGDGDGDGDANRDGVRLLGVDLPGHGATDPALDRSDLAAIAHLLGTAGGRATYVGYSMGGRVALRLALDRPDLVERLVLIGATAGIDDPDERAARRDADARLADHLIEVGTAAFVDEWLRGPLFADLRPSDDDLAARLANRADGLAASLRHAGTGTMDPPWWDELTALQPPTLLLAGEHDPKFRTLAARLAGAIGPSATEATIPGAGHAVHLEQPGPTADVIAAWLADHRSQPEATA